MLLQNILIILTLSKCVINQAIGMNWADPDRIAIGNKHLVSNTSTFKYPDQITYNITYSFPLSGTVIACAFGIQGFQSPPSINLSIKPALSSCTQNWFMMTINVGGDTVLNYMMIFYIVQCAESTFLHIQSECFVCSTLNSGSGTRSENRSITTTYGRYVKKVQSFLNLFDIINTYGVLNTLYSSVQAQIGKQTFTVTFTTYQNNTVNNICYSTIVYFDQLNKIEGYLNAVHYGVFELSNSRSPEYYNMPTTFRSSARQFFGISGFNMSRIVPRLFRIYFTDLLNLNLDYQTNIGTFDVQLSYVWIAKRLCNQAVGSTYDPLMQECWPTDSCPTYTVITEPNHYCSLCHYSCNTCSNGNSDACINCKTWRQRTLIGTACPCQSGYLQVGIQQCYPCSYFIGGCNTCSSSLICTNCFAGFNLNSSSKCECNSGFLVSGYCTTVYGCTSAIQFGSIVYCTSCNSTLLLQLNQQNYTCQCITGYQMSTSSFCKSVCGDGILISNEQCDDGNNVDGDGCSSICILEEGWTCTTSSPSVCTYVVSPTLSVKYVKRITNGNTMRVAFQVSPVLEKYSTLQFNSLISTNIPNSKFQSTYSNGILIVDFDYTQTIQGKQYQVYLQLNQDYFNSTKVSTTVKTTGMNTKLTYDSSYSQIKPLQIVVIVLCAASLLIYIMTTFAEGMIGVQTILTIQSAFYGLLFIQACPSMLSPLQQLRYTTGYNFLSGTDQTRTYTYYYRLSALGIEKQFLLTYNLMFILMMIVMIICLIVTIIFMIYKGKLKQFSSRKELTRIKRKLNIVKSIKFIIVGKIFLLIAMISMPTIWVALSAQMNSMNPYNYIVPSFLNYVGAILAVFSIMSLVFIMIADRILLPQSMFISKTTSRNYPLFYTVYQFIFFLIVAFTYQYQIPFFVLLGLTMFWGITIGIYRPYQSLFHNGALLFHQIVIAICLSLYIFADYNSSNDSYEAFYAISCYLIIILIIIVLIVCLVRIFMECKCRKDTGQKQHQLQLQIPDEIEQVKPITIMNKIGKSSQKKVKNVESYYNESEHKKDQQNIIILERNKQYVRQSEYIYNIQYQGYKKPIQEQQGQIQVWQTDKMNKQQTKKRLQRNEKKNLELSLLKKSRNQQVKNEKQKKMSTFMEYINK